jgi:hypothetical protein
MNNHDYSTEECTESKVEQEFRALLGMLSDEDKGALEALLDAFAEDV